MCQDRALELEKLVQDPEFEGGTRVNILQGTPYNPLVLQEKLESLETSLAEKERQLLGIDRFQIWRICFVGVL